MTSERGMVNNNRMESGASIHWIFVIVASFVIRHSSFVGRSPSRLETNRDLSLQIRNIDRALVIYLQLLLSGFGSNRFPAFWQAHSKEGSFRPVARGQFK